MASFNGGEAVVEALRCAGLRHVFGLLGSSTMELYDALYDCAQIDYIGVRDERTGTHMADAYGRVSDRPAVILAGQAGPGSANMVTGLAQAKLAYSPVVAITGLVSSAHVGRDAFQEIDQSALFAPVSKRTFTVPQAARIPEFVQEACRLAMTGRRGPVVVQIPRDLFAESVDVDVPSRPGYADHRAGGLDQERKEAICRLLRTAQAPVIIAGAGVKWGGGSEKVVRLAESLQIPITASAGHGDVVANDHPLFFGQVGPRGNAVASRLVRESDVVLALGTRLGFNTTFYTNNDLPADARIVHVDIDGSAVGRYYPVTYGVVADAGHVAEDLRSALSEIDGHAMPWAARLRGFQEARDALWREREEKGATEAQPLKPERVFAEMRKVLPRDALVTLDAGTMCLQATDQLVYHVPPALLTPLDFGLVGFSYAAGLGARTARPDRPVVSLMGDGGFAMTMSEITTAVQSGIKTVAVVLDNGCWGAEKSYQRDFYNGRYIGCDVLNPPYDQVARLCGGEGYTAERPGEVADALSQALASDKPAVVHVKVDPDAMISFRRDSFKHRSSK